MARESTINNFGNPFPLQMYVLAAGASLRSTMPPGTMMHAILRTDATGAAVGLAFTTQGLSALPLLLGAQVGIMRLPQ